MLNNNNRFQLNRAALNVQPLVIKQQATVATAASAAGHSVGLSSSPPTTSDDHGANGGNLSPSILINLNDINSLLTSINSATVTVTPSPTATPTVALVEAVAAAAVTNTGSQEENAAAATSRDNDKKFTQLGDYIFFAQQNQPQPVTAASAGSGSGGGGGNDLYGSAFNTKTKEVFFWKKFDKRDYMKKLEPYMIMDGVTDKIYRFSEIIHECHYADNSHETTASSGNVYVLFNPHYGDLHSFMKEKRRLDETEARAVFRQCVEAVQACHEHGIIIRDIKLKKFVFLDPAK